MRHTGVLLIPHAVYNYVDIIAVRTKTEDEFKARLGIQNIDLVSKCTVTQCRPSLASHRQKLSAPTYRWTVRVFTGLSG